jgi:hypothetical protein
MRLRDFCGTRSCFVLLSRISPGAPSRQALTHSPDDEAMRLRDCHEVGLAASFSFQQLGARKIKLMVFGHEVGTHTPLQLRDQAHMFGARTTHEVVNHSTVSARACTNPHARR